MQYINKNIILSILISLIIIIISFLIFKFLFFLNFWYEEKEKKIKQENNKINKKEMIYNEINSKIDKISSDTKINSEISEINSLSKDTYIKKTDYIKGKNLDTNQISLIDEIYRSYFESINKYDDIIKKKIEDRLIEYNKNIYIINLKLGKIKKKLSFLDEKIKMIEINRDLLNIKISDKQVEFAKEEEIQKNKKKTFKSEKLIDLKKEIENLKNEKIEILSKITKTKLKYSELLDEKQKLEKIISDKNAEIKKEKLDLELIQVLHQKKMIQFKNIIYKTYNSKLILEFF
ncbi:hypothetical protein [Candidatus Phytoplasma oryzae]|nr:hypothetical protein PIE28_01115 [Candidatus Phytoplasma oryzae]